MIEDAQPIWAVDMPATKSWVWEEDCMTGEPRGAKGAVAKILHAAQSARVDCCLLIGAAALSAYGAPRYTEDVDFLLAHADARRLVKALIDAGFKGPPPSRDVFYWRMLAPRSTLLVDVLGSTEGLYADALASATPAKFLGLDVMVPSTEFYVLLKLSAAHGDDDRYHRHLGDIQDLRKVRPVDMQFVSTYVRVNEPDLRRVLQDVVGRRPGSA